MAMTLITLTMMTCTIMNQTLFCDERLDTRKEVSLPKAQIVSLESLKYRFAKNLHQETLTKMIFNGKKEFDGTVMNGCQLNATSGKTYIYEFPCKELKKVIKSQ